MSDPEQLKQAIAALEGQRMVLGDAVVDAALTSMREKLASLEQQATAQQQRKQVTILFADVSGFTALSETMDAEDITNLMNRLWEHLDVAITGHGGTIDKHIGDAVMALWGAHQAREDDPERAVRAALAMQQALALFREECQVALAMRIGINTGSVLLGAVATTAEYTAMGDAVNLASRLEHSAPSGGVLISHDSYRHVRGLFDVQPLPPISVKGKSQPIQVYLVLGAKPRSFFVGSRGVEGVETRMIGREEELLCLQRALQVVAEAGTLQAITLVGEAGVGKSRLLFEVRSWLELQPQSYTLLNGRATQEMQRVPYALLRDVFALRFAIQESDTPAVARVKLLRGIASLCGSNDWQTEKWVHSVGHLLGFDFSGSPHISGLLNDARELRRQALRSLVEIMESLARKGPIFLALEDIHWADDASLDALQQLLEQCRHLPLLVQALTRPTLFERRPDWGKGLAYHQQVLLQPLTKYESRLLVDEILKQLPEIPEALRELIVSGAEGNPFYVEELIKMLIEERVILPGPDNWQVNDSRLSTVTVPATLRGVLQARLDSLAADERGLLQRAAVIGRTFWDHAIAQLAEELPTREEERLAALRQRELIYRRAISSFGGAQEFLFKHVLLREVTYESILKRQRRLYHARAAAWLSQEAGERSDEYAAVIAAHYEQAGEAHQAGRWYVRAGRRAQAGYANSTAIETYQRALAVLPAEEQALVLLRLGEVLELMSHWDEAHKRLLSAAQLAETHGQQQVLADSCAALGRVGWMQVNIVEAQHWLERAREKYTTLGDDAGLSETLAWLGVLALRERQQQTARNYLEAGLVLARSVGDPSKIARALNGMGLLASSQDQYSEAAVYFEETLSVWQRLGNRRSSYVALSNLSICRMNEGKYAEARALLEEAIAIAQEIGAEHGVRIGLNNLGNLGLAQGDLEDARHYYAECLTLAQREDDRLQIVYCLAGLAAISGRQGQAGARRAALLAEAAQALLESTGAEWESDERPKYEEAISAARASLAEAEFEAASSQGRSLPLEQVIAWALEQPDQPEQLPGQSLVG